MSELQFEAEGLLATVIVGHLCLVIARDETPEQSHF
jgi:hypothetical protein